MTVVEDKKQKRVGIPKEFSDKLNITKKDGFEFTLRESKLNAELIKGNKTHKKEKGGKDKDE